MTIASTIATYMGSNGRITFVTLVPATPQPTKGALPTGGVPRVEAVDEQRPADIPFQHGEAVLAVAEQIGQVEHLERRDERLGKTGGDLYYADGTDLREIDAPAFRAQLLGRVDVDA